jgi:hypothetical protein
MLRFCTRATVGYSDRRAFTTASYGMHNPGVKGKVQKNADFYGVSRDVRICSVAGVSNAILAP